jgi:hypothetical protein
MKFENHLRSSPWLIVAVLWTVWGVRAAHGTPQSEQQPQPDRPSKAPVEVTTDASASAASVADAPRPGQADGVAVGEERGIGASLIWGPRVALMVPRYALELVFAPIRFSAWAFERFALRDRAKQIFFNDSGEFGVYPVAFVETGFGLNAGLRAVHKNLFDQGEKLQLRASYGGRFKQFYSGALSSGSRLGPTELKLECELALEPNERFFGIGNNDTIGPAAATTPINALSDATAVDTRFNQERFRLAVTSDLRLRRHLYLTASAGVLWREYDDTNQIAAVDRIDTYYVPSSLVGFGDTLTTGYGELELRYDSRASGTRFNSDAFYSTGWLMAGYVGISKGLDDDPTEYARYGVDLQRYINLYDHSRVLVLRTYMEGVTGSLQDVPFVDLPRLGGALLLRGYDADRFRDRALTLASAEYRWEIGKTFAAALFVDTGRVWRRVRDIDASDWRVGYGVAIEMQSDKTFLARFHVASSIDGGLFINFGFDPVYDTRARMERK